MPHVEREEGQSNLTSTVCKYQISVFKMVCHICIIHSLLYRGEFHLCYGLLLLKKESVTEECKQLLF